MDTSNHNNETPTRARTRNAILKAAVKVLTESPGASLGDVADAALVARSTLHRYFPERADLVAALSLYAEEQIAAATKRARTDEGAAAEALIRLIREYFDEWDTIVWAYMQSQGQECHDDAVTEQIDPDLTVLIERGYADGTIDPALPNAWIQNLLWAVLYTAWEYIKQGSSRHEALDLAVQSVRRLAAPVPTPGP